MILQNAYYKLRPVEPEDADFMWCVESDSLQWIQNMLVAPFSKENLRNYAENYEADPFKAEQLRLIMVCADNGRRVGIVDLYDISAQHRTAWIGIYILPEFRGRGVGAEALEMLESYAKRLLNLRQLAAKVVSTNEPSMNLFLNANYNWIGSLDDWILSAGSAFSLNILQKNLLDQQ